MFGFLFLVVSRLLSVVVRYSGQTAPCVLVGGSILFPLSYSTSPSALRRRRRHPPSTHTTTTASSTLTRAASTGRFACTADTASTSEPAARAHALCAPTPYSLALAPPLTTCAYAHALRAHAHAPRAHALRPRPSPAPTSTPSAPPHCAHAHAALRQRPRHPRILRPRTAPTSTSYVHAPTHSTPPTPSAHAFRVHARRLRSPTPSAHPHAPRL
ncbi:hypothetical protein PLICRDRAFT_180403 [Plicaturopsis crispa FD-325 SS-3]|uniref:Uncharacterized protein n=1 Tax=Plicaturopsis crispa FD-325 SS-3 TaxID=944288 RepID=A0A0C9T2K1_PLICR|nr:hypothetical protein PLICRDRAFT_180403 [Plicaturopsis crispa FD-325 SS-3]